MTIWSKSQELFLDGVVQCGYENLRAKLSKKVIEDMKKHYSKCLLKTMTTEMLH